MYEFSNETPYTVLNHLLWLSRKTVFLFLCYMGQLCLSLCPLCFQCFFFHSIKAHSVAQVRAKVMCFPCMCECAHYSCSTYECWYFDIVMFRLVGVLSPLEQNYTHTRVKRNENLACVAFRVCHFANIQRIWKLIRQRIWCCLISFSCV